MKLLIVGIDGADYRIMSNLEMPFTNEWFAGAHEINLREDVWSRGWAEIYTGQHGRETKAFYEMPALDGTSRFTRQYGWRDSAVNADVRFLWDILDKQGVGALFMNIPTTFPAPKLTYGNFVAGAGGGLYSLTAIPEGLCSSEEIERILESMGYIVDLRYTPSGIRDMKRLFFELNRMLRIRTDSFIALAKEFTPIFGFVAFRATAIVQYLFMREVEEMIEGKVENKVIHRLLGEHYRILDGCIEKLVSKLSPSEAIFASDHGCVPYRFKANANAFLIEEKFQVKAPRGKQLKDFMVSFLPNKVFLRLREMTAVGIKEGSRGYHVRNTLAFSHENIHGIYVNDKMRFGGPVDEGRSLQDLVEEICTRLNEYPEAQSAGIVGRPYRRIYSDAFFSDYLPDIFLSRDEDVFFEGSGAFLEPNKNYRPIDDLGDVDEDIFSGQKGSKPLCVVSKGIKDLIHGSDPTDLTLVFKLVMRTLIEGE